MALITRLNSLGKLQQCLRAAPRPLRQPPRRAFFAKPSQSDLKLKDDVPDHFVMIYRNTMSKYIFGAQVVSFLAGGLVLVAFAMKSEFGERQRGFETWSPAARATRNEELFYVAFFVLFLVLVQVTVAKTPLRIYKVPQTPKYVSVSYGNLLGKEKFAFKRGEISQLGESGFLPWKGNRFVIESEKERRSVILLEHYFRRPADMSIMLGEQKDPDL